MTKMTIPFFVILCHNFTGDMNMIKEKRRGLSYTQEEMAKLLNISLRQYVRIDHEEDLPRRDVLNKLIQTFQLSDDEIGQYIRSIAQKIA